MRFVILFLVFLMFLLSTSCRNNVKESLSLLISDVKEIPIENIEYRIKDSIILARDTKDKNNWICIPRSNIVNNITNGLVYIKNIQNIEDYYSIQHILDSIKVKESQIDIIFFDNYPDSVTIYLKDRHGFLIKPSITIALKE